MNLHSAPSLLLALDLDGTLIPFAATPREAVMSDAVVDLVAALAALPGVCVAIVTGRQRELVEDLLPRLPGVRFAVEHGVWRYAHGVWEAALPALPQLDEIAVSLEQLAAKFPGALVERKRCSACLHWRRVAPERHDAIVAQAELIVDEWLEMHPQLERLPVTEALEVRHRAAHKGSALGWLRESLPRDTVTLALGDDITDEDMFVSLREQDFGILVGEQPRTTQALLRLPSVDSAHRFLRSLLDARQRRVAVEPGELVATRLRPHHARAQLIVASNRLPALPSADRKREVGGLVSALLPALAATNGMWLGWSGAERDPGLVLRLEETDTYTRGEFDYPAGWRERFYAGFCNQSLWPLLHAMPGRVRYVDEEWECYGEANRAFARLLREASGPKSAIWVQDFHLMLVGRELRRLDHEARIGFFLHVPFPSLDVFETLPWAAEMMDALLHYDRIGLQATRWYENFVHAARGLLGAEGELRARARATVVPGGIDPDRFAESSTHAATAAELASFESMFTNRQLILGVDRLDYSKGIPERLEAFARLLEKYPEWRGKVSFVQVSVPTRSDVTEYAELRARVELLVGRINGTYGEADWTPVRYLYRSYDQDTLARLYRLAAVCLVTPLRDGMNLVAKEYLAAQDPESPGVLVLSRFCGAAEELPTAMLVNPYHADGTASSLDAALRMPIEERRARHAPARATVWKATATAWAQSFLSQLVG